MALVRGAMKSQTTKADSLDTAGVGAVAQQAQTNLKTSSLFSIYPIASKEIAVPIAVGNSTIVLAAPRSASLSTQTKPYRLLRLTALRRLAAA
jgi:hypothetical protein